ncbi:MAG TPA: S-layer homology domain-containing protein, partial [Thermoanaerobaculia bacterium]
SGTGGTPGCQTFPVTLPVPVVIDNNTNAYVMTVGAPAGTNLGFLSYRVSYRLQVSPAPAVATFADVPTTHPFFRFIEALADAGITGGCTPAPSPNFCPDAPLTRGQMAVFLAAALGLHFPN